MKCRGPAWLTAVALATSGAGCKTRLWELGTEIPPPPLLDLALPPPSDMRTSLEVSCRQDNPSDQIDLLFLVDNSGSMEAMQDELKLRFADFFQLFSDLATMGTYVNLHIGVITCDYGAGKTGTAGCEPSPGGQRARLQALGANAPGWCRAPVGANYIAWDSSPGGSNNLPASQTLLKTFTCMASVGAVGCGMEHVLEATRAALHDDIPENAGFLRDDALLAVVFLTNEDDCSAPPDTDLFDDKLVARYGVPASYRCTRFGVMCGDPAAPPPYASSSGPLAMCLPAPNPGGAGPGVLYDVSRYIEFFTKPKAQGGVKANPGDVVLMSIAAPDEPFAVTLSDGLINGQLIAECAMLDEKAMPPCVPTLQRSCINPRVTEFYGDPAVRLNAVVRAAPNHALTSICADSYSGAMQSLGRLLVAQLGECCIAQTLPVDGSGDPIVDRIHCSVADVTTGSDGSTTSRPIAPCGSDAVRPCWRIAERDRCAGSSPQRFAVVVDRGGAPVPDHTVARADCLIDGN